MKTRILSLPLLISIALALPAIAVAAPANTGSITPADMRTMPAPNTLRAEIQGPDGELLATQPGEVEVNEGSWLGMPNTVMPAPVNKGNVTPADMRTSPAPYTLRAKIKGPDGELLATQPGEVEISESRRFIVR